MNLEMRKVFVELYYGTWLHWAHKCEFASTVTGFCAEEFFVLSDSCVQFLVFNPPSVVLSVIPRKKSFGAKGMQLQQVALCTTTTS